jgi:hypothetical protein
VLVIDVLSPSTEREDRGRKKFDFFCDVFDPAISDHRAGRATDDLYTRAGDRWSDEIVEGDAIVGLSSIGVEISLDVVYEEMELDATRPRAGGRQAPAQ